MSDIYSFGMLAVRFFMYGENRFQQLSEEKTHRLKSQDGSSSESVFRVVMSTIESARLEYSSSQLSLVRSLLPGAPQGIPDRKSHIELLDHELQKITVHSASDLLPV